jgi:hypothetical protein
VIGFERAVSGGVPAGKDVDGRHPEVILEIDRDPVLKERHEQ